jgi:peptidoglycan/LPS O-acetylase OafA/YrhL
MRRIKELDSIRGLAALMIVFYHLWFQSIAVLGNAVDLFFVLSGYLITTIILTNALTDRFLISFYLRRGLRIWPIYYLTLLAMVLVWPFLPPCGNLDDLPYYLTFTQEVPRYKPAVGPSFPSAFRHTWTLAIEEQFYLIWPPLLWWLGKRRLPAVALSLVAVGVTSRALNLSAFILPTHCDALALGGLLAGLLAERADSADSWRYHHRRLAAVGLGATVIWVAAMVAPRFLNPIWPGAVPDVVVYIIKPLAVGLMCFSLVGEIVLRAGHTRLRWLRDPRLVYLGTISYGIYLYHHFIFEICKYIEIRSGWESHVLLDLVKLAASVGIAALSWRYVERPILAMKSRFGYSEAAPSRFEVHDIRAAEAG